MIEKKNIFSYNKGIYLTIMIYPLWSLFLSIKHFRMPQAKNLFWLFCCFLGLIHIYFPEGIEDGYDGTRYAQNFITLHQQDFSLNNFISSFFSDEGFVDIYQPVITFLLSIVTGNPHLLFLIFAIVFGFFYSRNIWFILRKFPNTIGFPLIILTLFFMLICPIWEINGVRMWTALHVFVYGALPYLYNYDRSKIIWCFISLFFHFSFFFPFAILLLYHFIPKSINILLAFYLISLLLIEINLEQVRVFLSSIFPDFLTSRINSYTNENYAQAVIEGKSNYRFYVEGSKIIVKWAIAILLFVLCVFGKKTVKTHLALTNLLCFSLFLYAISNILSSIPSVERFVTLSQMFAFSTVIIFYIIYNQSKINNKVIIWAFKVIPIVLIFPIIFLLRVGCDYYGVSLFFNSVAIFFVEDNMPIIQYVKSIL